METKNQFKPMPKNSGKNIISYGEEVLIPDGSTEGRQVAPMMDGKQLKGKYSFTVFPLGLKIHPDTGVINVDQSESGLKYFVMAKSNNKNTSQTVSVTIGGLNYQSGFYTKDKSKVKPIFNADAKSAVNGRFTVIGEAKFSTQLSIDSNSGVLDLDQTFKNIEASEGELTNGKSWIFKVKCEMENFSDTCEFYLTYFDSKGENKIDDSLRQEVIFKETLFTTIPDISTFTSDQPSGNSPQTLLVSTAAAQSGNPPRLIYPS